jgi:hypothetical protein
MNYSEALLRLWERKEQAAANGCAESAALVLELPGLVAAARTLEKEAA